MFLPMSNPRTQRWLWAVLLIILVIILAFVVTTFILFVVTIVRLQPLEGILNKSGYLSSDVTQVHTTCTADGVLTPCSGVADFPIIRN